LPIDQFYLLNLKCMTVSTWLIVRSDRDSFLKHCVNNENQIVVVCIKILRVTYNAAVLSLEQIKWRSEVQIQRREL